MSFIEIKDLKFSYLDDENKRTEVLKGINLNIEKGEFLAILGRNGSGKSTLAKLLNMILEPESGEIIVDSLKLSPDLDDSQILAVRKNIGMVFQNPDNQLIATVVEEDVAFGPENLGIDSAEIKLRVESALETVGMTEYRRHAPSRLSGGQKQRVAIAGILAMMPRCIILDEATAMLDPAGRSEVMNTVRRLNSEFGITIVHITHNMDEVVLADRVVVMDNGVIALEGSPREVFSNVEKMTSIGLAVPQVTELFYELSKLGVSLPEGVISEDEAAELICSVVAKKNKTES